MCVCHKVSDEMADEIADEVALLNALEVSKIVKRPRKKKWGRPVLDDHKRIMSEVELARGSPDPDE